MKLNPISDAITAFAKPYQQAAQQPFSKSVPSFGSCAYVQVAQPESEQGTQKH